jgi:acyl dehydratase
MTGRCIEEFLDGAVDLSPGRTITETDVVAFSWVSDVEYSANSARATSKPDRGVLKRRMELIDQGGDIVQTGVTTTMVLTRAGRDALRKRQAVNTIQEAVK